MEKEKNEAKTYKQSQITRYKKSDNGSRYKVFLEEKGCQKEAFEKKEIQIQGTELAIFFESKKWKLKRNSNKTQKESALKEDDYVDLIKKISASEKCSNDEKIELINKALTLDEKEKDLAKLQKEIDAIKTKINSAI